MRRRQAERRQHFCTYTQWQISIPTTRRRAFMLTSVTSHRRMSLYA